MILDDDAYSSALLQGRPKQAGAVSRIPANEIEALVIKSV